MRDDICSDHWHYPYYPSKPALDPWFDRTLEVIQARINHGIESYQEHLKPDIQILFSAFTSDKSDLFIRIQIVQIGIVRLSIDYYQFDDSESRMVQMLMAIHSFIHWDGGVMARMKHKKSIN